VHHAEHTVAANDHFTVIGYWDGRWDEGMPGAILSCKVVATHVFSSHNCVIENK